jgi:hypothetical protein
VGVARGTKHIKIDFKQGTASEIRNGIVGGGAFAQISDRYCPPSM